MCRRAGILGRVSRISRGKGGREPLIVCLHRNVERLAQRKHEVLRRFDLFPTLPAERERQPDDVPERLTDVAEIEACHSVAGEESYVLKVRVPTPGALEDLLARIRSAANVRTRTTVVLSTPWEGRPTPGPTAD